MKVTSIALAIAAMGSVDAKEFADRKTPFQRRIEKSFDLFDEWGAVQMAGHSKYSELVAEFDNKSKFRHKFDLIQDKVVGYYRRMLAKVAEGCETELDNCEEYLSCSGFGTKLNDLTRSKPLVTESDYFLEFTKAHLKRSVRKCFSAECGADSEKLAKFLVKFNTVVEKARGWRAQCDRYSATACPSHCELIQRKKGLTCMPQGWTRPVTTD